MNWQGTEVLVAGGASLIGSHLTDALVERGARVRVADDLSSGSLANLSGHLDSGTIELQEVDLLEPELAATAMEGIQVVFHLAAVHGGRGYIDTHQVACATNLILDGQIYRQAARSGVERVVFASSGCVYPNYLQNDPSEELYLHEEMVGPPYDADGIYGWAKFMGERTLAQYCQEGRLKGASLRYFTVYGPRCPENHAVIAMIARALVKQDPFEIWGTGKQIRNWTHVDDIVQGTILAAERIDDGTAINLGTMERISVIEAAKKILRYASHEVEIACDPSKPTGPYNRVCDNSLARELLDWTPAVPFDSGVEQVIDWYFDTKNADSVAEELQHLLLERGRPTALKP